MLSSRLSLFKPKQEIQDLKSTLNSFNLKIEQYCSSKTKEIQKLNSDFQHSRREIELVNEKLLQELDAQVEIKNELSSNLQDLNVQVQQKRETMEFLNETYETNSHEIQDLKDQINNLKSNIDTVNAKISSNKRQELGKKAMEKPILEFYERKLGLKLVPVDQGIVINRCEANIYKHSSGQ